MYLCLMTHKQKRNCNWEEVQNAQTAQFIACIVSPYHRKLNWLNSRRGSGLKKREWEGIYWNHFVRLSIRL